MNMKTYLTGLSLVAAIALSCCGQKAASEENLKSTAVDTSTNFDTTGYTSGIIVQSKAEGDCEWTIQLKSGDFIEAMDMNTDFLVGGKKVWVKYTPQRRMQRCDKASPVAITEMVARK